VQTHSVGFAMALLAGVQPSFAAESGQIRSNEIADPEIVGPGMAANDLTDPQTKFA
jgi:hypothetical protein